MKLHLVSKNSIKLNYTIRYHYFTIIIAMNFNSSWLEKILTESTGSAWCVPRTPILSPTFLYCISEKQKWLKKISKRDWQLLKCKVKLWDHILLQPEWQRSRIHRIFLKLKVKFLICNKEYVTHQDLYFLYSSYNISSTTLFQLKI